MREAKKAITIATVSLAFYFYVVCKCIFKLGGGVILFFGSLLFYFALFKYTLAKRICINTEVDMTFFFLFPEGIFFLW